MTRYIKTIIIIVSLVFFPGSSHRAAAQDWSTPEIILERPPELHIWGAEVSFAISKDNSLHLAWAEERNLRPLADSLYYAHIVDKQYPVPIRPGPGRGSIGNPRLALDADNIPHIIWTENDLSPGTPLVNRLVHTAITENGRTTPDTLFSVDSLNMDVLNHSYNVTAASDGGLYAYWSHENYGSSRSTIWLRSWYDQSWTPAILVLKGYLTGPNMFIDCQNSFHVTFYGSLYSDAGSNGWRNISHVWYSVRNETDSLWCKPVVAYYNPKTLPCWPQIVVDANSGRHILWQEDLDWNYFPDMLLYKYSHDGKQWSNARDLSKMGEIPFQPRMVVDSRGIVHIVWHQSDFAGIGKELGIYYTSGREDTWSEPKKIFEPERGLGDLVIDSRDRLHLLMVTTAPGGEPWYRFRTIEYTWKDLYPTEVVSRDDHDHAVPSQLQVRNYPNPFNHTTVFSLSLQLPATVSFEIYNISGQLVKTLVDSELLPQQTARTWDGTDQEGRHLPSGFYLCRGKAKTTAGTFEVMCKVLLMR